MAQKKAAKSKKVNKKAAAPAPKKKAAPRPAARETEVSTYEPKRREVGGAVFGALAFFTTISYFTDEGSFIRWFSDFIKGAIGYGYWITAPVLFVIAYKLILHRGRPVAHKVISGLLLPVLFSALVNLFVYNGETGLPVKELSDQLFVTGQNMQSGGTIGGLLHISLEHAFSVYGSFFVLLALLVLCLVLLFGIDLSSLGERAKAEMTTPYARQELERKEESPAAPVTVPEQAVVTRKPQTPARKQRAVDVPVILDDAGGDDIRIPGAAAPSTPVRKAKAVEPSFVPFEFDDDPVDEITVPQVSPEKTAKTKPAAKAKVKKHAGSEASPTDGVVPATLEEAAKIAGVQLEPAAADESPFVELDHTAAKSAPAKAAAAAKNVAKKAERAEIAAGAAELAAAAESAEAPADYVFPPTTLLNFRSPTTVDGRDEALENRKRLDAALASFGINAGIVSITQGPTVTRYDIELEQGVKLAKVTNLAGDLALALGVVNVRIAPIPDKISTVGIEVPNKHTSTVYLREILESTRFTAAKSKISFAIGKDIGGDCIVGNISKLPHMLIAGTTGSGKSVCMNSLILSLLYKARPDEVKLIMIDPKMVELGIYNGIPHLYVPVVTDPKKAAGALQWSVVEMMKRYRLFSGVGVRDLEAYNRHCEAGGEQKLPQVVIVIDELADLMLVASKEVEESICRVAQMGRAAGMHLVIATQRPSADVITGLMKANIPSRIAFAVSSAMESRIILDQGGAEKLIGMGDMLYAPVGCGKPTRIQGAFVSDEEREQVVTFIKEHSGASEVQDAGSEIESYMNKALETKSNGAENGKEPKSESVGDFDEFLPQAVEAVLETKMCSVSMLQRKLKLGYARAARIVDQMEELGVVGQHQGAKPRDVLLDRAGWQELAVSIGVVAGDEFSDAAEMNEELE